MLAVMTANFPHGSSHRDILASPCHSSDTTLIRQTQKYLVGDPAFLCKQSTPLKAMYTCTICIQHTHTHIHICNTCTYATGICYTCIHTLSIGTWTECISHLLVCEYVVCLAVISSGQVLGLDTGLVGTDLLPGNMESWPLYGNHKKMRQCPTVAITRPVVHVYGFWTVHRTAVFAVEPS